MEEEKKICPKCNGEMENGELIDKTYFASLPQRWGSKATSVVGIGIKKPIEIISFRCMNCGFLENYAKETDTEVEDMKRSTAKGIK